MLVVEIKTYRRNNKVYYYYYISSLHTAAPHRRPAIPAKIMTIVNSAPARQKGRTHDVLSTFPASNRAADLWMDVRVTHSTQRTMLDKTYKFCCDVYHAEAKFKPVVTVQEVACSRRCHRPPGTGRHQQREGEGKGL